MFKLSGTGHLGCWITVSIGIAPNRFWSKTAANLIKPDGLVSMNHQNADQIYSQMQLVDINGVNIKNEARLHKAGIYTPLQFAYSSLQKLTHEVFQRQATGHHWYLRLRGYETDNVEFKTKSIGHSYALQQKTNNLKKLEQLFIKLCDKTGTRLRKKELQSNGIYLSLGYLSKNYLNHHRTLYSPISTSWEIFYHIREMLHQYHTGETVTHIAVSVFKLSSVKPEQPSLYQETREKHALYSAIDQINNKFGTFTITPATMLDMDKIILDRIAFGKVKDMRYQDLEAS